MNDPGRVLIIGAGPTGLGAAYRMQELGFGGFTLLEAQNHPGGLAGSHVDDKGFTWDTGGHVQFSHYDYYDRVLDQALERDWLYHERESWVWIKGRFVPYPFQNNIHRLDPEDRDSALRGLERAAIGAQSEVRDNGTNFRDWIQHTFGEGIAEMFLYPYNFKVWGYPAEMMGVNWIGERVSVPDLERIRRNIRENRDDVSWGPNNKFRFPLRGGTGAIWMGVARLIRPESFLFGSPVERIDLKEHQVVLRGARRLKYDMLITSMPLDRLSAICEGLSPSARQAGNSMIHSSVHILGVGIKGEKPETLQSKCWMYFPEFQSPYYRVTVFSNYSPYNVPMGSKYWSLMAEVCESTASPVDAKGLKEWTLQAMKRDKLLPLEAEIASFWHRREEYGYPTPFLGRDEALRCALSELERHGVYSRGRFGAWKYEVSNQDHSFMQGVELVDRLLHGKPEVTVNNPTLVNSGVFLNKSSLS